MSEQEIEQESQEKDLNAPRLTPDLIDNRIWYTQYYIFPGTTTTVCCLVLKNGFTIVGKSACASPDNFDAELGQKIAFEDARNKLWVLEGYLLKQKLHEEYNQ